MRVQISSASGTSSSPAEVSTTSSGVPAIPSPVNWMSLDCAHQCRSSCQRTWRGRKDGRFRKIFKHRTSDEIVHKILACGKRHPLFNWQEHVQSAKLLRLGDRIASFKMKNRLPFMILAKPAGPECDWPWLRCPSAFTCAKKNLHQSCQPFGKVREEFSSHFTLIAAGPENPRDNHPTMGFGTQSSSISSV